MLFCFRKKPKNALNNQKYEISERKSSNPGHYTSTSYPTIKKGGILSFFPFSKHDQAKLTTERQNKSKSVLVPEEEFKGETSPVDFRISLKYFPVPVTKDFKSKYPRISSVGLYPGDISPPCGPFSNLLFEKTIKAATPPPLYMKMEQINCPKPVTSSEIFLGKKLLENGMLQITDKAILEAQKGIVMDVLKRLAESISQGTGVVGVSLPVRIFEPISMVERICDFWAFAPVYLPKAAQTKKPVERMKLAITYGVAGLYVSASSRKPFNPILGETFEGFLDENTHIFVEHISHHPPISSFYVTNPSFKLYGTYELCGSLNGNSLNVYPDGLGHIEFPDGEKISYSMPICEISGMLFGNKNIYYKGIMRFIDTKNSLKAIIEFKKRKNADEFIGKLYKSNNKGILKRPKGMSKKDLEEMESNYLDLVELISEIKGSVARNCIIGDETTWRIDEEKPFRVYSVDKPLPSDARFREDLIWLKNKDIEKADDWKRALEKKQRYERSLRQAYAKAMTEKANIPEKTINAQKGEEENDKGSNEEKKKE